MNRMLEFSFRSKLNRNCDRNPALRLLQIYMRYRLIYPSYMPLLHDATSPLSSHLVANGRRGIRVPSVNKQVLHPYRLE
jgi:hypothetical protein